MPFVWRFFLEWRFFPSMLFLTHFQSLIQEDEVTVHVLLFQRRRYRYWCFTFFTTCFILYRRLISRPSVTSFVLSLGGMIPIRSLIIIESYIFKLLYLGYDWMFSFVRGGTYILEREESIPMATQPVSVHLVLDSIQMSWLMVVKWYLEKANF